MYAAGIEPASEGRTDASVRQALLSEQEPDPAFGMAGVFLSLRRVLPNRYPLALDVERYVAEEQRLGRLLDYAVIVPRLQRMYEWSAWSWASHACSSWFATATRSTHGPSKSGTCGAPRTCHGSRGF
jgi:hypothetical protein